MTVKLSTGLRNDIVGSVGFAGALANGVMEIYSGPQPLAADNAPSGTLLGVVTLNGGAFNAGAPTNGLNFDPASNGTAAKPAADSWKFTGLAAGTAGWFRFKGNAADAGAQSTTLARLDGSIGVTGADLNLSNINVAVGAPNSIDVFQFTMPAQ